ncbi:MAG TPA: hypothetical protein VMG82_23455 [Candidatus Sulfotelmatobacter sp.]|nr:hypothetical protein [Candidatus Sulfotelmatobacter sp.]
MKEANDPQTSPAGEDVDLSKNQICNLISNTELRDTNRLFGCLQHMASQYYGAARSRATESFWLAQIFGALGITCVGYIGYLCLKGSNTSGSQVAFHAFAAVLVSAISSLNFALYYRSIGQFELFQVCLERLNRYSMANSVSANMDDSEKRDAARGALVSTMANAQMLPIENVKQAQRKPPVATAVSRPGPTPVARVS